MTKTISNTDDVIDSRDVIARIDELNDEREALPEAERDDWDESDDGGAELAALEALAEEAAQYADDWQHGATLIHDSYFTEYAQQLAEDIGAISSDATWPNNFIDWEAAADALKLDYTEVDFDGQTYWIR